jgi:hypothetical protein
MSEPPQRQEGIGYDDFAHYADLRSNNKSSSVVDVTAQSALIRVIVFQ